MVVYQDGIQELTTAVAYCTLVVLNIIIAFIFMRNASRRAKRDLEETLIRDQLALQAKHYAKMTERYDKLRKLRHDFNNHIQVLNALNDTGKQNETHDYIGRLSDEFNRAESVGFCGNSAVDAVLFHKQEAALASDIRIEYQVMLPKDCGISEFDLCGIFANLLDNAIAACLAFDGEKYINLETKMQAGYFVIVQKNACKPPGEPNKNDDSQGLGLKIISDIANRYNGNTYFEYKDNQFISVINLSPSESG